MTEMSRSAQLDSFLQLAMAMSGAQKGALLLSRDGQLTTEVMATLDLGEIRINRDLAARGADALPLSVIAGTQRTRERLILDDAPAVDPFATDGYVLRTRPLSIACLPICRQAELIGLLYLENELIKAAFSPERVAPLVLLAEHAVALLDSAELATSSDTQRLFHAVIEHASAIIYVRDLAGKYLLINQRYEDLFHIKRDAVVGKTDHDLWPREVADSFRAFDLQALAAGRPIEIEEVAPHDDGLHTYLSIKAPLFDSAGNPYAIWGMSTDITGRKRAEQELEHYKQHLEQLVSLRTSELAERNRETAALLDNLPQGVFTIGKSLRIEPRYSPRLPALLGLPDPAGRDCSDALLEDVSLTTDQRDLHNLALEFSFGVEPFLAEMNWVHLVRTMERPRPGGTPAHLEVDWAPIVDDEGQIAKILVSVRDVTLLRELEQAVAKNARDTDLLQEALDAKLPAFQEFCRGTRLRIAEDERLLGSPLIRESVEQVFRNLHTIKGNARTLGLTTFAGVVHRAEEPYVALRADIGAPCDLAELLAGSRSLSAGLDEYEQVVQRNFGEILEGPDPRLRAVVDEIAREVRRAASQPERAHEALLRIAEVLARVDAVSVDAVVKGATRMLRSLSEELGKPVPRVEVEGRELLLAPWLALLLGDVLVHALRNAVDHGIEAADLRVAAGKAPAGTIRVRASLRHGQLKVRIGDDGRGLPVDALRERYGAADESDEEIGDRIFTSGVSTAAEVTSVSGRGVGMDAIRAMIAERGGQVGVPFTGQRHHGHRPFELVLELPAGEPSVETLAGAPT